MVGNQQELALFNYNMYFMLRVMTKLAGFTTLNTFSRVFFHPKQAEVTELKIKLLNATKKKHQFTSVYILYLLEGRTVSK